MPNSIVWSELERFNGEKFDPCIKKILIASGYNKFMSLAEIDDDKLRKIEEHVNKNHKDLIGRLKCCYCKDYKSQDKFEFLPGHKSTILGLKNKIALMKADGLITSTKANRQPKCKSEIELRAMLVTSLENFAKKQGLPAGIFTDRNIVNFSSIVQGGKDVHKCGFSCAFCRKVISVVYKGYWMKSNITKHIKEHITQGAIAYEEYQIIS